MTSLVSVSDDANRIVDKYLDAVGLSREQPTHSFLCLLLHRHMERFPMSSVLPCLGASPESMGLDTQSLYNTIVRDRRGGYCFQQNKLLYDVLVNLNYQVRLVLARVTNNKENFRPGLTHRISLVNLPEGTFVVDVAFGEKCPPGPVPLDGKELIVSLPRRYRVFNANKNAARNSELDPDPLHMQVNDPEGGKEWYTTYKFDLGINYSEEDCKVSHFFSSQSPDAVFVNTLFVSKRRSSDCSVQELAFLKYRCIGQHDGSELDCRIVESAEELRQLLLDTFEVHVTEDESARLFAKNKAKMEERNRKADTDESV